MGTEPIFIKWSDTGAKNRWSEIDGFHWGHFAPMSGVRSPFLYSWWLWAQFAPVKAQCGISKGKSPVGWGSSLRSRTMIWEDPNKCSMCWTHWWVQEPTHLWKKKHESCFFWLRISYSFWPTGSIWEDFQVNEKRLHHSPRLRSQVVGRKGDFFLSNTRCGRCWYDTLGPLMTLLSRQLTWKGRWKIT